ncbi:MAG: hypothetical protein HQK65_09905 [Desulfamplus sp.]|nr:hypothetical protein [Desulfamplus sp.]
MKKQTKKIIAYMFFFFVVVNSGILYSNIEINLMKPEDGVWQVYPLASGSSCAGFSSSNLDVIIFNNESNKNIVKIVLKKEQKISKKDQVMLNVDDPSIFSAKIYNFKSYEQVRENQISSLSFIADIELIKEIMKGSELFLYFGQASQGKYNTSFRIPLKGSMLAVTKAIILDEKKKDSDFIMASGSDETTSTKKKESVSSHYDNKNDHRTNDVKIKPGYARIELKDVNNRIGENVALLEKIDQVSVVSSNGNIYFNIGGRYPHQKLGLVVFSRNSNIFSNPYQFEGNFALIQGKLSLYKGKPQIIVEQAWQIIKKD